MISKFIQLAESGMLPDFLIRAGIVSNCKSRIKNETSVNLEDLQEKKQEWISVMKESPIALVPDKANQQHYEVPPTFFMHVLGSNLKYSSGYWPNQKVTLDSSEEYMLSISVNRADIKNGQRILELGCGWGSLTCFMAKKFPNSQITAVSNSKDQRRFINNRCKENQISNVNVITADMNDFNFEKMYDRVISIEMFEHMRNYKQLLSKIAECLKSDGKLFIHIFSHNSLVYPFENKGEADWMAREFFSGGMMPSHDLLLYFQDELKIEKTWRISGVHYEKTSLAWLKKMDKNKKKIMKIFSETYGKNNANLWFQRWRIFFMSCEKLFGYNNGSEWGVSHYRFSKDNT